jgi:hypothetical protein
MVVDEFHLECNTEDELSRFNAEGTRAKASFTSGKFVARVGKASTPEFWVWYVFDCESEAEPEPGSVVITASGQGRWHVVSERNAGAVRAFLDRQ